MNIQQLLLKIKKKKKGLSEYDQELEEAEQKKQNYGLTDEEVAVLSYFGLSDYKYYNFNNKAYCDQVLFEEIKHLIKRSRLSQSRLVGSIGRGAGNENLILARTFIKVNLACYEKDKECMGILKNFIPALMKYDLDFSVDVAKKELIIKLPVERRAKEGIQYQGVDFETPEHQLKRLEEEDEQRQQKN